jgi:peroxiredoxin
METLLLVVRLILVGIFALAGIGKLLDLQGSKKAVRDFGVPEILVKPVAVLLPIAEIAVALLLLFVQTSWYGAIGAAALLAVFIGGMTIQMIKGNAPDCHCFGQIHSEPVSSKSLIRNAVFAILALFLVASGRENQGLGILESSNDFSEGNVMQIIIGLAVVALLAAAVYFLRKISEQQTQIMRRIEILELTASEGVKAIEKQDVAHPESGLLIGSPAPDFVLPDLNGKNVSFENLLVKNKPVLFFYVSPSCGPCSALLPDIEKWQDELKDKLNFVLISSGKAKENAEKFGGKTFKQVLLQKDKEVTDLFGAQWTPTAWLVNPDGTIASRPAAGDAAIKKLIDTVKAEIAEKDLLYIANGNGSKSPLLGKELPEFSLEDISGNSVTTGDLRGKKTLVTYWSLGCGFCTKMLDELREWDKARGQDEPDLLLLSSGNKEENQEMDLKGTVVLDDKREVAKQIGMSGTPSAVLVNEEGKVVSEIAVGSEQIWKLIGKRK